MRLTTVISIFICCASCRSTAVHGNPSGEYAIKGKDYEIYLNLRPDSSFIYREKNMEVTSEAKGKWKYNLIDTIYLMRDTAIPLPEMLASGYIKVMPDRVVIKSKNAIKVGASTLNRK